MAKYQFHRLGSDSFQEMVQSLLEAKRREYGGLIQFGSAGADGAREATWTQPIDHPDYVRPANSLTDVPKQWIFQVKFHDIGLRGWSGAGSAIVADLKGELEKITTKYKHSCHHFVLITNIPLTGASRIGTRDKVSKIASDWKAKIPCIEVWDAADLSRMLDNNPHVRTTYHDLILPGDVLSALHSQIQFQSDRKEATFRGYLKNLVDNESKARAEEAGDDDPLPLSKVFIDQTLQLDQQSIPECYRADVDAWESEEYSDDESSSVTPEDLEEVSSAFPLLWGAQEKVMLLAGPGYGKSTITQFLALYHAGRIIDNSCSSALALRLKLPPTWTPENLDASCTMRFPFRVELRRYAKWRKSHIDDLTPIGIASYIARQLIGGAVESTLSQDDIFGLISSNPTLLILDGLDEVPNKDDRDAILKDCDAFLYRCSGENVDLQIVMSSRPQGYHGEFDRFQPLRWIINDLSEKDFYQYSADWLSERIKNPEERAEAEERIKRGMASDAVRRLATTLLQATVMLTIVRKKSDIPEERHKLFEKYVDVVFQREKSKNDLISRYEPELKLLHEMVGYQIHEAVARGEAGVVPEEKFKDLVWNVWRLIRGDEQINAIPNQEILSIYELSTDRLVFLSGKGTSQSDIDFVIQPYREYFAANYMASHWDADPEKVFKCLVDRGPYWQQVLRFFAAISMPAQRLSWAFNAALPASSTTEINDLRMGLPARRAVMFSLPEFGRLQFEQFRKIIAGCIPEREWWTWIGQDWVIPIIGGMRSGETWRLLWKTFIESQTRSYGSADFALLLFPQVISKESEEFPKLLDFVSSSLSDPGLASRAVEVVLHHELPIDLSIADEDTVLDVLLVFPYRSRFRHPSVILDLIKRLPRSIVLRFLCGLQYRFFGFDESFNPWRFIGLPVQEVSPAVNHEAEMGSGPAIVVAAPSWLGFEIAGQLSFPDEPAEGGIYSEYLRTLFEAIQKPEDAKLYEKAAITMKSLDDKISWRLRCECVLGPSPDQFGSDQDWVRYRHEIREFFDSASDRAVLNKVAASFGCDDETKRNQWVTLLFPPSQWNHLVSKGLVGSDFIEEVRQSRWARLAGLINGPQDLTRYAKYSPLPHAKFIPVLEILSLAVELHNQGLLVESPIASEVLAVSASGNARTEDLNALIGGVQNPSKFPETWAKPLVEIALAAEGIDLRLVSEFWTALNADRSEPVWLHMMPLVHTGKYQTIIAGLVELGSDSALELAAIVLFRCPDVANETSKQINRLAASSLLAGGVIEGRKTALVRCLFHSTPTIEEARLYSNQKVFKELSDSAPYFRQQVSARINLMPQSMGIEDYQLLICEMERILSIKSEHSAEVSAAALNALIQLEVARCKPLSESDWRVGS